MDFYLSRNTRNYGGTYTLTTYLPQPPKDGSALCWWYWPPSGSDLTMQVTADAALGLTDKARKTLGQDPRDLDYGEAMNLQDGHVCKLVQMGASQGMVPA